MSGLAKRANLVGRVDKHDQALEELSHLVLDEVGANRQGVRRLTEQRKADHPVLHNCVAKILALEAKVEQLRADHPVLHNCVAKILALEARVGLLEAQLEAERAVAWWRRPWW